MTSETLSKNLSLGLLLGWQDVKQAYRRSSLGPFWITAGMAVQVGAMGLVFGLIFRLPLSEYLPFLATSIVVWGLISSVITDGCNSFIVAESIIKQRQVPIYVFVLRTIWKQMTIFGHNLVIVPFAFLVVLQGFSWSLLLVIPGLAIAIANLTWIAYLLAILSARYRDIPQVVTSVMTILYFVSPVMWKPEVIPADVAHLLLGLNPMYHILQVVRLPILGEVPTLENWLLTLALALAGGLAAFLASKKYKNKIAYWV